MSIANTACQPGSDLPDGPRLSDGETTFRWLARPYELLDECAATFGDRFTLRFTRAGTHVVVSHPDDVRDVLTADRHVLSGGRGNGLLEPVLGEHSLLLVDGDRHMTQRALLQPAFRPERVQAHARLIAEETRRHTATWRDGAVVGMQQAALEISRNVILRAVLGVDDAGLDHVGRLIHDLTQLVGTNAPFDDPADGGALADRFRAARTRLHAALDEHVARRREGAVRDDVLGVLLAARTEAGAPLPADEIRDQLMTMILAGHETTASSIAWTLLDLHATPHVLEAVLRELDGARDRRPTPYLQATCLEALRLHPVIPVVSREVRRPFRLGDRMLAPGVFVTPCIYLAHRRRASFPDATTFRPERFLARRFSPYAYLPFGGGARRCIGMSFALLEMEVVLGVLLRGFTFAPVAAAPARPVRRGVTIVPSGGARMRVEPRSGA